MGDHHLQGFDRSGRERFGFDFSAVPIADARAPGAAGFSFALPQAAGDLRDPLELRVSDSVREP